MGEQLQNVSDKQPDSSNSPEESAENNSALQIRSLAQATQIIRQADELLANPNFDPAALFAATEVMREKIDGIAFYDDEYRWRIEAAEGRLRQMQAYLSALRSNHERLKSYARHCVEQSGGDELPGNDFRIVLQSAQPSVRLTKEAVTAQDYLEHPTLVRQIPRKYEPDKAAIREALEAGVEVPFAELVPSTYVRIYPARVGRKKPKKVSESKTKRLKEGKAS